MKLLVDDRWFGATGIGRYAHEILKRAPHGVLIEELSKTWAIKNPLTPLLLGIEINRRLPDLFWSPGFMPPLNSKSPYIVTVHDLIHLKFGSKLQVIYYNNIIRPLLKKAACILTVSEYSKHEVLNWVDVQPDKVVPVYNAVSAGFSSAGEVYNPGYPYLLYVGNKRKHKNLHRLLSAFANATLPEEMKLVLTGDATKELSELAEKLKISHRLVFLGYVQEETLPAIYRGATALMFVSLYEGFGIPLLEGMACGVPVLSSGVTAIPEISGGAAHLVNPEDIDEITTGIEDIVNNVKLREYLISRGNVRSREFSWETTASDVWRVFTGVSA